ncbi:lytic transglycosylase domain-containing protein [Porticoccaceae bacterium LTM1]|nr:lytic transglycosylase domain-containing protein [Porticoccaceae bacterium LTM1]
MAVTKTKIRLPLRLVLLTGLMAGNLALAEPLNSPPQLPQPDTELVNLLKESLEGADSFVDIYDAQVWLMAKSQPLERFIDDEQQRYELLKKIHREATKAGLQPEIVLAVIEIESGFDRFAISRVGARGMMQIMPFWKKELGRPNDNLMLTDTNLRYGCTILKYYLDKEDGNVPDALARYNGSYGTYKYSEKVLKVWDKHWR